MKLFKLYTIAALALASVTFTACENDGILDDDFTPGAQSAGAYFSNEAAESYEIEGDATSVTFDIYRSAAGPEVTYDLAVENPDAAIFTAPAQITFAAEALSAPYTITFDPAKISDGQFFDFTIALPAGAVSNYGEGTYAFTIGKPEPWESIGIGIYTDDIVCSLYNIGGGKTLSWKVEIQQNGLDKTLYRLVNPYATMAKMVNGAIFDTSKDYSITFHVMEDNSVYFSPNPFCTGITLDPSYGVIYGAQMKAGIGVYEDGVITFPTNGFGVVEESEMGQGWYKGNTHGAEMIVFPGVELTDYSAAISYAGYYTDAENNQQAVVNVQLGADVENARVACAITTDANALLQSIVSGEANFVETAESGEVRLPLEGPGEYIAMVVAYGEGEPQMYAQADFEILGGAPVGKWTSLGQCDFIDGWFIPGLKLSDGTAADPTNFPASCEIQKSDDTPGVYRLVAPFTSDSYLANQLNAIQKDRNIVINCEDPSYCFMEAQKSGWGASGIMGGVELAVCDGGYLYPALGIAQPAQVAAAGLGSTLTVDADGVSTIFINRPYFGKSTDPDDLGYNFAGENDPIIPSVIMFVEEDTPAAQAALKKKVIGKTIEMLSGNFSRKPSLKLSLIKANSGAVKYKHLKKAKGATL